SRLLRIVNRFANACLYNSCLEPASEPLGPVVDSAWGIRVMLQDIRQALLSLAKRPSSAVLTVVVFALAIGANTTVFSVFNGFFLRPLPFPDDDRLVMIYDSLPRLGVDNGGTSIPGYLDWRFGAPALEEAAIFAETSRTLHSDDPPEQVTVT